MDLTHNLIEEKQEKEPVAGLAAIMQAAVYRGVNDVRVETVPVPEIGPGEVLVRIHTCGICGTDLKKIHSGSHSAPRIFGHEMSGTIAKVGEGVTTFAAGDRVMAYHHIPCGECYYCRKKTFAQCLDYQKVGCTAGFAPSGGGFAEYIRVMDWIVARGLVRIPDDIPFEQAAFIEPVNTCYKAIDMLALKPDETVLVIGQGPIGILLAALANRTGAKVLTSDLYPERHAVAAGFGLTHPLDARGDVVAATKAASEGRGADVVLLAVPGNALIKLGMDAVRPGGRVMLFAATQHGEAPFDPAAVCMDEKTLMGSYSAAVSVNEAVAELVFEGYRDGSFDLTKLISHRFSLEDAVQAIEVASNPQPDSLKIVIQSRARPNTLTNTKSVLNNDMPSLREEEIYEAASICQNFDGDVSVRRNYAVCADTGSKNDSCLRDGPGQAEGTQPFASVSCSGKGSWSTGCRRPPSGNWREWRCQSC